MSAKTTCGEIRLANRWPREFGHGGGRYDSMCHAQPGRCDGGKPLPCAICGKSMRPVCIVLCSECCCSGCGPESAASRHRQQ